ncbi:penicillin acylase family protein [Rudanella paleaurantiibacter]|uniref:Penicillin acylase family protein n=1 Tax=Rudanella paleaurantiibacter TaxID=2614655 RepID=A0A7J5U0G3_9BACT|nr:penicillin acylase family protein [Rudanella paleaurantiibacter]KAB7731135.1 penicillin acylase family protein [Rudanella paleaurantiibacter]
MRIAPALIVCIGLFCLTTRSFAQLQKPVEVIRDRWGVNHIYAQTEHDLFYAQGYCAAQDRLFQLEMWRRQATGTVAELLGPQELKRDQGARLFRFRTTPQTLNAELNHYHPRGAAIIRAFVEGINAYITEIRKTPDKLPFEFKVLKTEPGLWTPEIVISRHQGLLSNVRDELNFGRLVYLIGAEKLRQLQWFHPTPTPDREPNLTLRVDGAQLMQPILELYDAFRLPLKFTPPTDTRQAATGPVTHSPRIPNLHFTPSAEVEDWFDTEKTMVGSNNWVVDGRHSVSGYPMLANDPHRAQSAPSLRYWVHLHGPGWNVVGAGEPTLPGVSIGHNEYGAWGLTIFETDNEDLYVYETNPRNPNQYRYQGRWEPMRLIRDTIRVKGGEAVPVMLKYTRHGPVTFEDTRNHKAYAVRAGWLEKGCAPYLASLRMNGARNWTEFRQACAYSRIPGENMIWAGRPSAGRPSGGQPSTGQPATKGDIGWQAVGISPIRPAVGGQSWTGLVPVPGDGRYEWSGYLPIQKLPNKHNPPEGYVATANNNLTPIDFPDRNAVGWVWAGPSRAHRIEEVLNNGERKTLTDFARLQADYLSIPARTLVPLLGPLVADDSRTEQASSYLRKWNYQLEPGSVAASIYVAWETQLRQALYQTMVPERARPYLRSLPTKRILDWLSLPLIPVPDSTGGSLRLMNRDSLLLTSLDQAVSTLTKRLGGDMDEWQYGQRANKHISLTHPLSALVSEDERRRINLGPIPRGGYSETVNNTGSNLNQEHGASFRILVDTEDWDRTLGINSPGQSGDPASPHYRDLFELWGQNGYFPVFFSREKVKAAAEQTTILRP